MYSFFGSTTATIFQILALLAALGIEIWYDNKKWKRITIILSILFSIFVGIGNRIYEKERLAEDQAQTAETRRTLEQIGTGVSGVSDTSKDSLSQINQLRKKNIEQQSIISNLYGSVQQSNLQSQQAYSQYRAAQERVIALSQEVVTLREGSNRESAAAQAARVVAAEESRQQTKAANRSAAQAACAASFRCSSDGFRCSQVYVDLQPYGGGYCLSGGYSPSN